MTRTPFAPLLLLAALAAGPLPSGAAEPPAPAADGRAAYAEALAAYVGEDGRVDYAGLARSGALDPVVAALAEAAEPADPLAREAFWIDAYNALTLSLVAANWPLGSIRDLDGGDPWSVRRFRVAGRALTLNDIEHGILRPMGDPRVHAAVNCASRGCPPLARTPYAADPAGVDAALDAAARRWVAAGALELGEDTVAFNRIFEWYAEDFRRADDRPVPGLDPAMAAAARFCARYLPADRAAALLAGGRAGSWIDYDWSVNAR